MQRKRCIRLSFMNNQLEKMQSRALSASEVTGECKANASSLVKYQNSICCNSNGQTPQISSTSDYFSIISC
jgi:hypothetical protein